MTTDEAFNLICTRGPGDHRYIAIPVKEKVEDIMKDIKHIVNEDIADKNYKEQIKLLIKEYKKSGYDELINSPDWLFDMINVDADPVEFFNKVEVLNKNKEIGSIYSIYHVNMNQYKDTFTKAVKKSNSLVSLISLCRKVQTTLHHTMSVYLRNALKGLKDDVNTKVFITGNRISEYLYKCLYNTIKKENKEVIAVYDYPKIQANAYAAFEMLKAGYEPRTKAESKLVTLRMMPLGGYEFFPPS